MGGNFKNGKDMDVQWNTFVQTMDEKSYREIYSHYYRYLSFIGFKKNFSPARIKDCINDLFLYLWENGYKLGAVRNHHNYIVTGFLRKLFRTESLDSHNTVELEEELFDLPITPSVEMQVIQKDIQSDIKRIVKRFVKELPVRQRQMIYQKFYIGLSYQEISKANNVSINTVYSTIYTALDKLRKLIGKEQLAVLSMVLGAIVILFFFFLKNHS